MTGELAVCAASCGPGNLHLINGLFDANRSRVPVLAIAAHIPARGDRRAATSRRPTRRSSSASAASTRELVSVPEQLPRLLEIAMRAALERGGVAVVVVPGEIFLTAGTAGHAWHRDPADLIVVRPADDALDGRGRQSSTRAERVTILAGAGCRGAHDELVAVRRGAAGAGRARVPRQGVRRVRQPVRRRHDRADRLRSGYRAMEHCDALLMLGTDFPYRPVLSRGRARGPGRRPGRAHRPPRPRRRGARRHGPGHRRRAAAAAHEPDRLGAPGPHDRALPPTPESSSTRSRKRTATAAAAPAARHRAIDRLAADDAVFTADVGTPRSGPPATCA